MSGGIRARVRAQMTDEIKTVARRHLASDGANLSLRAVARDVGVVSSAIYRYFASRDELLTALILDAYNSLGAAVEAADRRVVEAVEKATTELGTTSGGAAGGASGGASGGAGGGAGGDAKGDAEVDDAGESHAGESGAGESGAPYVESGAPPAESGALHIESSAPHLQVAWSRELLDWDALPARWMAVCHAVRDWALSAPHEYALIYGSPVPGYRAPAETVAAATRAARVLGGILQDGALRGRFDDEQPLTGPAAETFVRMATWLCPDAPASVVSRAMGAWVQLFGAVSFELFGQLENAVGDKEAFFEHQMRAQAAYIGL